MDGNVSSFHASPSAYSPIKEIINLDKAIWDEYRKDNPPVTPERKKLVAIIENLKLNKVSGRIFSILIYNVRKTRIQKFGFCNFRGKK